MNKKSRERAVSLGIVGAILIATPLSLYGFALIGEPRAVWLMNLLGLM